MQIDRLAPLRRPPGRPAGFQRWQTLLFLHWEVEPAAIQRTLPEGLTVDTHDGRAFIGVVPFTMRDVAPRWSPSVPGISHFHELNVRTYVVRDGVPGVWFYSLDAASTVAVLIARLHWKLPYHRARMRLERDGDRVTYESRRLFPAPKPGDFSGRYRIGDALPPPQPGSLLYFLVERYVLFAQKAGRLQLGRVHHVPYPLQEVTLEHWEETVIAAQGIERGPEAPMALFSEGVDVDVYALT